MARDFTSRKVSRMMYFFFLKKKTGSSQRERIEMPRSHKGRWARGIKLDHGGVRMSPKVTFVIVFRIFNRRCGPSSAGAEVVYQNRL